LKAGLAGLPAAWRARKAVQAARRVSSAAIARALTWSPAKALARDLDVR
ncbi:glycosyltransferase family 2 protein, partial [Caulobacter sp. 17J65-9]|nr:glycosyltransferase family 2 protein [Caulobacter sp. 17J65-9]